LFPSFKDDAILLKFIVAAEYSLSTDGDRGAVGEILILAPEAAGVVTTAVAFPNSFFYNFGIRLVVGTHTSWHFGSMQE
jgi:hypothetical protein